MEWSKEMDRRLEQQVEEHKAARNAEDLQFVQFTYSSFSDTLFMSPIWNERSDASVKLTTFGISTALNGLLGLVLIASAITGIPKRTLNERDALRFILCAAICSHPILVGLMATAS